MSDAASQYTAAHIQVLEGREAIRKRPGMYVGSTREPGLHNTVFEVSDWAVNEVLAGRAEHVDVTLESDGSVRVAIDGPGIPVEAAGHTGDPSLEALLTRMHAGPRGDSRDFVGVGLFGMGPFVTNALSSHLTGEVRREGVRWVQHYDRGGAVGPPSPQGPTTESGTVIAFRPDADIFGTAQCSFDALAERFRTLAFLNRGLAISLTDRRPSCGSRSERFLFPGGVRDFVAVIAARTGTTDGTDVFGFEYEDPQIAGSVEVAMMWSDTLAGGVHGFANSMPTPGGGAHVAGLRDAVAAAINAFARERRLLTKADTDLGPDRLCDGLTAVVSVKLDRPEFEGATRDCLGNAEVRESVAPAVRDQLIAWLAEDPRLASAVVGRIAAGTSSAGA
ncbi:ATP-binding protein [Streptomyces chartreusis]|uniref:DNA topoisomerase (ATP-hydrolyzing) n=1 Tax=Streptomyces chartreusis TaxID=1969 RepID=A0A7I0NTB9_STRCX|nr:ATP-binding protein [Streptomyces chartreusis]QKZ16312.1 DNA gyrase subunit B [Streptomyces chartreusis]